MEISNIIEDIENLIYSILVLLILVPKTIYKLITDPSFSYWYIKSQFYLEENERFKDYASPLILFISITLPSFLFRNININYQFKLQSFLNSLEFEEKILVFSLILAGFPLLISVFMLLWKGEIVNSINIKRPLYSLIYIFSYPYFCFFILYLNNIPKLSGDKASEIFFYIYLVLHLISQIQSLRALGIFYREELSISTFNARGLVFLTFIPGTIIVIAIAFLLG